jgi:hypothetical protein
MNPNTRVVRDGYEGGFKDVDEVHEIRLKLHHNKAWWNGPHEITKNTKAARAVLIR